MGWPETPMASCGEDHDTCRAPGGPDACYIVPHPFFQEALYHDLVVNVPYNPLKDYYSVNLPLDPRRQKLTLWGKTFWVCTKTAEERETYDRAVAEHVGGRRLGRSPVWRRALTWFLEQLRM